MKILALSVAALVILLLIGLVLAVRIVKQYEEGVRFRLGKAIGTRAPGLHVIVPFVDVLHRVSLRIVTMPIQSQDIITRDNVSVDVSAVAYFKVIDATKSVVEIEKVDDAIDQIAQTTLRKGGRPTHVERDVVGNRPDQHRHPGDPRRQHRRLGSGSDPRRA